MSARSFTCELLTILALGLSSVALSAQSSHPTSPAMISSQRAAAVATGMSHSCALTHEGGVKCWGDNSVGQLGDGTTTQRLTPVDVSGLTTGTALVEAGGGHSCAVTASGGAKCWGDNWEGDLGDGTTISRASPVDVSGLTNGVTMITLGDGHTCALTNLGSVKCWGWNGFGQLGDGTTASRYTPVQVSGLTSGVIAIIAGREHTCAVTNAGGVKCWGANGFGQLGDGTITNHYTPVNAVGLSSGVSALAAGAWHTCALTSGGGVKCWGRNKDGQVGDGTTIDRLSPVDVSGLASGVAAIDGGWEHSCALTTEGGAKCWGNNGWGQLGDGTSTWRYTPVDVSGLTSGVIAIAAGGGGYLTGQTCAVTSIGGVKCWGHNGYGQLGDGTTVWRFTPVDVVGLEGGPRLGIDLPARANVGNLIYVPISLTAVLTSDDLSGVQIGVRVDDTAILTPAVSLSPRPGNLFPADSLSYTVALTNGWDFILTTALSPTQAISGSGVIVELPFYAQAEGCANLSFADHLLTDSNGLLINHEISGGQICLGDKGNLIGAMYLQYRATGHFTGTLVTLNGTQGIYTTTADATGHFALTNVYSGTYAAYFTHPLFVHAIRTNITVTTWATTTMPEVGLWAGDMSQDGDVDVPDWYICAAASIPVDDPAFDITDDGATDIRDCVLLANNIGRPDMPITNPSTTTLSILAQGTNNSSGYEVGKVVSVPQGSGDITLRVIEVNGRLYAAGTRLRLPTGATVTSVNLRDGFAGGFLQWHQDNDKLYIVAAPRENTPLVKDTDMVLIHIENGNSLEIEAASPVGEPRPLYLIFLPTVLRN